MNEKTVKGEISAWTKEVKEEEGATPDQVYFRLGLLVDEQWYNIMNLRKEPLEKLKENAPKGSIVEFVAWNKEGSKSWKYKSGTFKIIKKGEPKVWNKNSGNWGYKPTKEEYLKNQSSIIIQSTLKTAVEQNKDGTPEATIKIAEQFLAFHNNNLLKQSEIMNAIYKGKTEEEKKEAIPETTIGPNHTTIAPIQDIDNI